MCFQVVLKLPDFTGNDDDEDFLMASFWSLERIRSDQPFTDQPGMHFRWRCGSHHPHPHPPRDDDDDDDLYNRSRGWVTKGIICRFFTLPSDRGEINRN